MLKQNANPDKGELKQFRNPGSPGRTRLIITLALIAAALTAFIYRSPKEESAAPPQGNISNQYLIGVMDGGLDLSYNNLSDLGLNVWHKYVQIYKLNDSSTRGWDWYSGNRVDNLYNTIEVYGDVVRNRLVDNQTHNMRTLMERPKIVQLAFGQRSDYQCEAISPDHPLWFYSFQFQAGETMRDWEYNNGDSVLHISSIESGPGAKYVIKRLKANNQQCNRSSDWGGDFGYDWYIKPKIRADKNYVDNHSDEPICRIDVFNFDGTLIKSTVIKAKHFKDQFLQYDGNYKEEFNFDVPSGDSTLIFPQPQAVNFNPREKGNWAFNSRGNNPTDGDDKMDIQVYWYDNCQIWIDYIRVDNDVADKLFKGYYDDPINHPESDWLHWEADLTKPYTSPLKFYIEEFEFNHLPCMSYVSRKLRDYSGNQNLSLMTVINLTQQVLHLPYDYVSNKRVSSANILRFVIDSVGESQVFSEPYSLTGIVPGTGFNDSKVPYTLPFSNYDLSEGRIGIPAPPGEYESWLQNHLDASDLSIWTKRGYYTWHLKTMDTMSKAADIPHINMPQTHLWYIPPGEVLREPSNEELEMLTLLPITYGARGTLYFWYGSWGCFGTNNFTRGLTDPEPCASATSLVPRDTNVYGQQKWERIKNINQKLGQWGPTIMSFDNANRQSYIYYIEAERNACLANTYFSDVVSYFPYNNPQPCQEDYPGVPSPPGLQYDCKGARYLQVATFKKTTEDRNKYFMIVNRRCSPFVDQNSVENNGGRRLIKARFSNHNHDFDPYNSWDIYEIKGTEQYVGRYTVTNNELVQLGDWFSPGEGRLFVMKYTMRTGGVLTGDEYLEDASFICEDTVWNDGHNITITGNSDVNFSDSATIIMDGGTFQSGDASGGPISNKITYSSAISGHKWGGLRFTDANVKIYNSEFKEIASPAGGGFAINTIDCPLNDFRYNVFTSSTDSAGGVNIAYVNYSPFGAPPNSYVMYNNFGMNNSYSRAVQVQGFAGLTEGVYVKGNTMTSNGYATGIFLSTITGGVIKNNTLTGFETAISTMSSTYDLYGNTISNSTVESKGIYAVESSVLNLAPSGSQWTGGMNNISNTKDNSININIDASNFLLMGGANAFDLLSTAEEPYHLYGSFVSESYNSNATGNCFKLSGTEINDPELPNNYLTNGYEQVTLDFISYNCSQSMPECSDIVSIGNGLYDTIPRTCGGGGGESNSKLEIKNEKFVLTPKQLQDSIKIQMRHRNYARVKILCNELIENFAESVESISSLQTLYMATVLSDTTTGSRSALKAFYEGLILNHGDNETLVEISNYLVQKCKVLLKQYTSALAGFQAIINTNQYNYRGLLARWDYMATSLLMQGAGGGETSETPNVKRETGETEEAEITDKELALLDGYDKFGDDKNPYSKEERAKIQKNVRTVNERSKNIGEKRIQVLEREAKQNNQRAKSELQRINTMKQVIRTEKPKNVIEHIKKVNNDIQTVFGSTLSNKSTSINNIPSVYRLSQNYPNPFNPVTTIKYELPKDSKVKLVVFDLLGREVKTLVNETKSAGYYQLEFNMQNYASGVYFYRIEADDLSGKKFIDAKKMVLVK